MADQLPHNDEDLQLARSIERAREAGISLDNISSDDPLIKSLLSYKQQTVSSFEIDETEKEQVWEGVVSVTQPSSETKVINSFGSVNFRWAAAAILLVGALFSFIYLQFSQQPELLAESKAAITSVQLSDGSIVTLRPHSRLYLLEREPSAQQYRLEGEGLFEVTSNAERTFSVETETGRVTVLGTSFTLSSWGQQMRVYLQEGSVKVEAIKGDSSIVLKPGQSASVADKNSVPAVRMAKVEEFLDWVDQQLIFENKPAEFVINELEQQFNISITFPPKVGDKKLTGQLSLQNLETSFQDLEIVLGGTFTKIDGRSYIFETD